MNKLERIEQELIRERFIPADLREELLSVRRELAEVDQNQEIEPETRKAKVAELEGRLKELESRCEEAKQAFQKAHPEFHPGDTIRVHTRIQEGDKTRIQVFQGVVLRIHRAHNRTTFTVRKVSHAVGVERVFPLYSPNIEKIEVVRLGRVRRARLYYLRDRGGKSARVKEKQTFQKSNAQA